jgi:pyruvate dehydrogenase E2 component (dihydrolipoamide acetyltransferase)
MVEIKIPRENANDDFVSILVVNVKNGDEVNLGDILFEYETSKAAVEYEAPYAGYIENFKLTKGAQVPIDSVVGSISKSSKTSETKNTSTNFTPVVSEVGNSRLISDAAKLLIIEGKQPLRSNKWVTTNDFKKMDSNSRQKKVRASSNVAKFADESELTNSYSIVKIDSRKQAEIKSLGTTSPYFNSTLGVSFELKRRRATNKFFEKSILDLVVYEASLMLNSTYPDLNACFLGNDQIARYDEVVAGIALDDLNNLTVASLPSFDNLLELSDQIVDVVFRFGDRKLKAKDLKSTTFTVTDLSNSGVDFVLPLINGSQGFILGITKIEQHYHIFGSFDHRVTEGKRFSSFLLELKNRILFYEIPENEVNSGMCCFVCLKTIVEEKSYGMRGLLKIDDGTGEKLICHNCFLGW